MSKTQTESTPAKFEGWRSVLWPIHNFEAKKFIPMGLIMFCLLFNYTLLRDTKDTLVVSATGGSNVITFLKLYCVTPSAILFVILYAKLSNVVSREKLFHFTVAPFLVFFGLFGLFLYPNLDLLHPTAEHISSMHAAYPRLSGFIDIYGYWAYSLFYVMSEIWGSAMISLLFWQFANQITKTAEAKRFYGMFIVLGNVALILSGQVVVFCSENIKNFLPGQSLDEVWQVSLYLLMGAVVCAGLLAMYLYHWVYKNVVSDKRFYDPVTQEHAGKNKKKKKKPGLLESLKILVSSPELGLIALLVMAYGVSINLVEVQWKNQLGLYFDGDRGAMNAFMGNFSTVTGIVVIFFSLFVGQRLLRVFKWFTVATVTPLLIAVGGTIFFMFIFAKEAMTDFLMTMALNPVTAATFLGFIIVIASKGVKYSLFDPTKEMAYIPLDDELKIKGKAAVDVIGGRAGKAGGAFVGTVLAMVLATKDVVLYSPYAFGVFAIIMLLWLLAVKKLSGRYESMLVMRQKEATKLAAAPA